MTDLTTALSRHAQYYSRKLREIDSLYGKGGPVTSKAILSFTLEWAQIRKGQAYASKQLEQEDWSADCCLEYALAGARLLSLRLPAGQRIEWLNPGLPAARQRNDLEAEAELWGQIGMANDAIGEYARSVGFYRECLEIARTLKDKQREGRTLGSLGLDYIFLKEPGEAKKCFDSALEIAREINDRMAEGRHLGSLGLMSTGRESIEYFTQALEIAREVGDRQGEVSHLGCLAMEWVEKAERARTLPGAAFIHPNIIARNRRPDGSLAKDLQDRIEEQDSALCYQKAATFFEQAVANAHEIGDSAAECRYLGELGNVFSRQEKLERALSFYEQAWTIAQELGDRQNELKQLQSMRSVYLSLADQGEVNRIEARLREISQEIESPNVGNILDQFGRHRLNPIDAGYWKMSRDEESKRYWSDYYRDNIAG